MIIKTKLTFNSISRPLFFVRMDKKFNYKLLKCSDQERLTNICKIEFIDPIKHPNQVMTDFLVFVANNGAQYKSIELITPINKSNAGV